MGRFKKDKTNLVRAIVDKTSCVDLDDSDNPTTTASYGACQVGETGRIQKRSTPLTTKIKAQLYLKMNRVSLFRSPEYRKRLVDDFALPAQKDPTASTLGLFRAALNPEFRDAEIGNLWEYTDGVSSKEEVRQLLINEADEHYQKAFRKGRFSHGSSSLVSKNLRRSERIRSLRSQVRPQLKSGFNKTNSTH